MSKERELLKQALECLLGSVDWDVCNFIGEIESVIAKPNPKPEPVAWIYGGKTLDGADDFHFTFNEPDHGYKVPLYTSPPNNNELGCDKELSFLKVALDAAISESDYFKKERDELQARLDSGIRVFWLSKSPEEKNATLILDDEDVLK